MGPSRPRRLHEQQDVAHLNDILVVVEQYHALMMLIQFRSCVHVQCSAGHAATAASNHMRRSMQLSCAIA